MFELFYTFIAAEIFPCDFDAFTEMHINAKSHKNERKYIELTGCAQTFDC